MFRGTICSVKEANYLLKKINDQVLPEIQRAKDSLNDLETNLKPIIQNLGWQDFELLVDLSSFLWYSGKKCNI